MLVFQSLMNNDVDIRRIRRTSNGQGGWAVDFVSVETARGRIRPASSAEREAAMLQERQISHVLYVEFGTNIVRGDQAQVLDLVVVVDAIREPSQAGEHLEIDCMERQFEESEAEGS